MTLNDRELLGGLGTGHFILLLTGSVHLLGSAVLFGMLGGPLGVLASPLLSLFGWFFVPVELLGVTVQYHLYDPHKNSRSFWLMLFLSLSIACALMALIGPKEVGDALRWTCAYIVATAAAVTWSMFAIRAVKPVLLSAEDE
ncbi:MAG: hypothetical protein HQ582_08440 [Planctomycetes bacterium]|nr:hypothetical protein [Planctomycetota bacterium]